MFLQMSILYSMKRFAVGDGSKPPCDMDSQPYYCGGNFQGIENNLDYILGEILSLFACVFLLKT